MEGGSGELNSVFGNGDGRLDIGVGERLFGAVGAADVEVGAA